jgi:hypothetical protein
MLTYRCVTQYKHSVSADGRVLGHIFYLGTDEYQYRPKGASKAYWGMVYDTFDACCESLMGENDPELVSMKWNRS